MTLPPPPPLGEVWVELTGNIGFVFNKGSALFHDKELRAECFSPVFISSNLVEKGALSSQTSEGCTVAPLLLKPEPRLADAGLLSSQTSEGSYVAPLLVMEGNVDDAHLLGDESMTAPFKTYEYEPNLAGTPYISTNFKPEFMKWISAKYKGKPVFPYSTLCYVYGCLNDPNYLNKYRELVSAKLGLKCIFVEDYELYRYIAWYGHHLMICHMMHEDYIDEREVTFIGEDTKPMSSINYEESTNKLWINQSSYFLDIDPLVYQYVIGGYKVLRKYANSYSGEEMDISHYKNIIRTLRRSIDLKVGLKALGASY